MPIALPIAPKPDSIITCPRCGRQTTPAAFPVHICIDFPPATGHRQPSTIDSATLLQSLGFTPPAEDAFSNTWNGHGLQVSISPQVTDPAILMNLILTAKENAIRQANRQHAEAILGTLPKF